MADDTVYKLNIQAGNSQDVLDNFAKNLAMIKDRMNQVGASGENFNKLSSLQAKAAESGAKLGVAQANAAQALKKAMDMAMGGTASAEQIAVAQAKAALAAEKVDVAENNLGIAMQKVQGESDRLAKAMAEEAEAAAKANSIFTKLKETTTSVASAMATGFEKIQTVVGAVSDKVTAFAENIRTNMESAKQEIVATEEATTEASGGLFSGLKTAGGGLLEFASKAGFAFMGVQMAVQMVKSSIDSVIGPAEQYQEILKQTNDVLESTKGAAGMSAKAIQDLATSLGSSTFYSRDAVQSGENLLLTFTNIGKSVFPQATKTMLDMSKAMGQDIKSSAIQMGKALNDPVAGITALTRVGVTFTNEQKNMIKSMVAAGNTAGAQKIILDELNKEFGGSADATKTFAGQWQILSNKLNDFKENIGMAIMPILSQLVTFISNIIMPVLDALSNFILNVVVPALSALGNTIKTWVLDKFDALKRFIDANIMPTILRFWGYIQNQIVPVLEAWGHNIQVWVLDKFNDLKRFIDANIMPKLQEFWAFVQNKILPVLQQWGGTIGNWVLNRLGDLKGFIDTQIMPKLGDFRNYIQNQIIPTLQSWGGNIKTWALDKFNDLKAFIETQVVPNLQRFWGYIQTQIIPVLQTWGNNIKLWVIDKFNDAKTYIETQFLPKLQQLWGYITTQIVPALITWGTNIKGQVLDKLAALKTFIETQVIPGLQKLWNFIQTQIIPLFFGWNDEMSDTRAKFDALKTFIDTQVMPVLRIIWGWINDHVIPVFQAVGNILNGHATPKMGEFGAAVGRLWDSLKRLWSLLAPIIIPTLGLVAWSVTNFVTPALDGLTYVLNNVVGPALNAFIGFMTDVVNGANTVINTLSTLVYWYNTLSDAIRNAVGWAANAVGIKVPSAPSGGQGGGSAGNFASGVENWGGGLAYVHANELLVNLPKGTSVWNPQKTSEFMKAIQLPPPVASGTTASSSTNNVSNDQIVSLLAGILAELQKPNRGGQNVTMNANVQPGSLNAQKINQLVQSLGGLQYEAITRGAW